MCSLVGWLRGTLPIVISWARCAERMEGTKFMTENIIRSVKV